MPQLTIEITEQQEAKIVDAILHRRDFVIDGGLAGFGGQLCPACNAACTKVTTPADPDRGRVVREKMQSMEACQSMIRREWERLNSKDRAYYTAIYDAVAADLLRKNPEKNPKASTNPGSS